MSPLRTGWQRRASPLAPMRPLHPPMMRQSLGPRYNSSTCRNISNQILGHISSLQALLPLSTKEAATKFNSGPAASLLPLLLELPLSDLVGLQDSLVSSQKALLVLRALVLAGNPPAHVRSIFMTIRSLDLNISRRIALEPEPPADMQIADILASNTRAGYHALQLLLLTHSFNRDPTAELAATTAVFTIRITGARRNALTNLGQTSCESEVMEIGVLALGIQVLGTVLVLQYI